VSETPATWHYGVVARYWAEFNTDGPEIEYFRRIIDDGGDPALDAGCGTGRLLIPWLSAGLDVDGADVSADMIALCRERAEREGLSPALYVQALHELDLPRRYRTIVVCGALGVGSSRERDVRALERLYEHLEPGGRLALDNEVPYANARFWRYWTADGRAELPEAWRTSTSTASDGTEYELGSRVVELDPLAQSASLEMKATMCRAGDVVADEQYRIDLMFYFRDELARMLETAGFRDASVRGGYDDAPPTAAHEFLVFVARK